MADFSVTETGKDSDGDITCLCGVGWSHTKMQAIGHIESGACGYVVGSARVVVYEREGRKHLRTTADSSTSNNLDELPDCSC